MKHPVRNVVFAVGGLLIAGSVVAYLTTGMYPYTRFRDAQIERANQQTELTDLFGETGDDASASDAPQIESVNAIGLLPSGAGMASLSVATLSGVGAVLITGAWWFTRRAERTAPNTPNPSHEESKP